MTYYEEDPYAPPGRARMPAPDNGYGNGHGSATPSGYDYGDGFVDGFGDSANGYDANGYDANGYRHSGGYNSSGYSDPYGYAAPEAAPAPFGATVSGRASVSGSASVPGSGPASGSAAVGSASVSGSAAVPGSASVPGRASVRSSSFDSFGDDGFDPFGDGPPSVGGRATVPPAAGRATVGRASVAVPRISPDEIPAGPGGPGGPTGPGRPDGGPGGPAPAKRAKQRKRRRRIVYMVTALIMLTGFAIMGITYFSSTISAPEQVPLKQATTLYYSDGKTPLAQIGTVNRTIIQDDQLKPWVKQAVIATEDATFYSNIGVDVKGIIRAFVNNLTGGETQGGSTITQQYARYMVNDYSASYTRKAREVVLAIKMNQNLTKEQILLGYLNTVDFGRGAYGIEAAAKAYFNRTAATLTPAQAMVLAGLIKSPDSGIYSPKCQNPDKTSPCDAAKGRFEYTKAQMKKVTGPGFLAPADVDQLVYPTDKTVAAVDWSGNAAQAAIQGPNGFIVHQVMSELSALTKNGQPLFPSDNNASDSLLNGGYQIVTTIDKNAQQAAITYAAKTSKARIVDSFPTGVGAAVVAVQPGTGNVLAYYGGAQGTGIDWAGIWNDPVTADPGLSGGHIFPGSNFKTVTMATALSKGLSIDSQWYGPDVRDFPQRGAAGPLRNASKGDDCGTPDQYCSMQEGLRKSLNTMYYAIGTDTRDGMSPGAIVDMAANLGIKHMWSGDACQGKRIDLTGFNGADVTKQECIGPEVSFGQFGVALSDLANVMATYANRGVRADEHFVKTVYHGVGDAKTTDYTASLRFHTTHGYGEYQNNDLTYAMTTVWNNANEKKNQLHLDRPVAAKTGTWELGSGSLASKNGTVLLSGFTAGDGKANTGQIAMSVWVGNNGSATKKVNGKDVTVLVPVPYSSDGPPADIFRLVANAYEDAGPGGKPYPVQQFTPHTSTGDPSKGDPTPPPSPSATPTPTSPSCDPVTCPSSSSAPPPDTTKPTPPGSLAIADTKPNQVTISWQPSTDDVGVVAYRIYRNGAFLNTSPDPNYVDKQVQPGKQYDYQVTAMDAAGNESDRSNTATAHT